MNEITRNHSAANRSATRRGRCDRRVGNSSIPNSTYNPPLGRWVQGDPVGYQGGANLYGYVGGMAASTLDPTGLQIASPGYRPPPPAINRAAAEAAEALLALLASELEWSWIPEVALAAILAAWELRCQSLYAAYKAPCDAVTLNPCREGMPCAAYGPIIVFLVACAAGRDACLSAGCDEIIPTNKNHPIAAANAWRAVVNCERRQAAACGGMGCTRGQGDPITA